MNKSKPNQSANLNPKSISNPSSPASTEKFINAQEASVALNLPLYFFINTGKRDSLGIPYYFIHRMVRYRLTELQAWHVSRANQIMHDASIRKQQNAVPSGTYQGGAYA